MYKIVLHCFQYRVTSWYEATLHSIFSIFHLESLRLCLAWRKRGRKEKETGRRNKNVLQLRRVAFSSRSGKDEAAEVTGLKIQTDTHIIHVVTFQRRPCYVHRWQFPFTFFSAATLPTPTILVVVHYFDDSDHYSEVNRAFSFIICSMLHRD